MALRQRRPQRCRECAEGQIDVRKIEGQTRQISSAYSCSYRRAYSTRRSSAETLPERPLFGS
ncbi:hypothetical protein J2R80_004068 [Bradyrhizobium sp. USDA 4541]|nr:hypothetical protein [Bradyrhizobium sp. USDA 4541]